MYHKAPNRIQNSPDFKRGYAMGIQKGRLSERKLSMIVIIVLVVIIELAHALA